VSIVSSDLSFGYKVGSRVLDRVSTEFRSKELSLIVGVSGGGKTTLIRCINGLIPNRYSSATLSGTVMLNGESVADMSLAEAARRAGTVIQDPDKQMVGSNVIDEIAFGLENLAVPRDEMIKQIQICAQRLRIIDLLYRPIVSLSGGEKQKVAIASILVMRPSSVLLDEPLAFLDPASAREAMNHFRELASDGVAVILAEHRYHQVIKAKPDHCIILKDGRITFDGDAETFPATPPFPARPIPPCDKNARKVVSFENVHFQHENGKRVLAGVSIDIRKGDIIALVGANGAGKTTLCQHVVGLRKPTQGRVLIYD